jgi:hypothetical protein
MTLGKNSIAKALNYRANWQGWAGRLRQVGDGEDQYWGGRRFRRNIETDPGIHGQDEVQNPDGWLPRLRKGKSWKVLPLKKPLPEGSEEKNKLDFQHD